MHAWISILDPAHMHVASLKIDIGPAQRTSLRGPQAVPENNQEQGRVPLAVAIAGSALISRSTSASVRYSRVHSLAFVLAADPNCLHFVGWR
jgi:hypothetical protein